MKPTDLTVRILQDIREEIHGLREEQREFREESFTRFETIENTLKDLAEQLVMLARGVKVAIEQTWQNRRAYPETRASRRLVGKAAKCLTIALPTTRPCRGEAEPRRFVCPPQPSGGRSTARES